MSDPTTETDTDSTHGGATGRLLLGLAVVAVLVTLLGITVVWALTYGPLG